MSLALCQPGLAPRIPAPYIPLPEAAAAMQCSVGHLRRLCAERFGPIGLAKKFSNEWAVLPDADKRLREKREGWEARDLRQEGELRLAKTPPKYVDLAKFRRDIVRGLDAFDGARGKTRAEAMRLYIADLRLRAVLPAPGIKKLSPRTLHRWDAAYKAAGEEGGIKALVKMTGEWNERAVIGPRAWEQFMQFRNGPRLRPIRDAYRVTEGVCSQHAGEPGWEWPSYRKVLLHYQETVSIAEQVMADEGPHKFRAKCLPKITRSLEDVAAGSHLVGDQRTFDFMARVPSARGWRRARLKLTALLDVRSRMFLGCVIAERANSDTILSSFRSACEIAETLPDEVTIDNGQDYRSVAGRNRRCRKWDEFDSKRVNTAFERLSVEVHYAIVRHPWSKLIESHFDQIKDRFDAWFPGYWGGKHDERPWDADRWTREFIEALPTIEEVRDAFTQFLTAHHEEPRNGDGMFGLCPRQALKQFYTTAPRRISAAALEAYCCKMVGPVKVGRDGVRYNNVYYGKHDEEVWRLQGKQTWLLVDPVRADRITLCDQDGVPTCLAYGDRNLGITQDEVRAAQAMTRRAEKTIKGYAEAREVSMQTDTQKIVSARLAAARLNQTPDSDLPAPPQPETLRLVGAEVEAGLERVKRVAGAESIKRLADMNAGAAALNEYRAPSLTDLAPTEAGDALAAGPMDLRLLSNGLEADDAG